MNKKTVLLAGIAAGLALHVLRPGIVQGAFNATDAGTSAGQFLKIGVGARAIAMGEAYGAISDDAYALYWNPAGLCRLKSRQLDISYAVWLEKTGNSYLAYAHPLPSLNSVFALGVNQLAVPAVDKYDNTGSATGGSYSATDLGASLGWSTRLSDVFAGGLSVKYIQSSIDNTSASAYAADIGFLYYPGRISYGLAVQNAGTKMKYVNQEYTLPLNLKAGAAYALIPKQLLLSLDVNAPSDNAVKANFGCEYIQPIANNASVAVRVGAKSNIKGFEPLSALSAGAGLKLAMLDFDVAWVPYSDLGDTFRTSLGLRFGSRQKVESKAFKQAAAVQDELTKSETKKDIFMKGHSLYSEGKYPQALPYFLKLLKMEPDHEESKKYVGYIKEKMSSR